MRLVKQKAFLFGEQRSTMAGKICLSEVKTYRMCVIMVGGAVG